VLPFTIENISMETESVLELEQKCNKTTVIFNNDHKLYMLLNMKDIIFCLTQLTLPYIILFWDTMLL